MGTSPVGVDSGFNNTNTHQDAYEVNCFMFNHGKLALS